jgi:hypothetical protein
LRRGLAHGALGGLGPADEAACTDAELATHWETWAHKSHAFGQTGRDETTYAYWRFIRGVGISEAVTAAKTAIAKRVRR